jgi:hypothetical protein
LLYGRNHPAKDLKVQKGSEIGLSGYLRIQGKYLKRRSNKKVRRTRDVPPNAGYKRLFGPFYWS